MKKITAAAVAATILLVIVALGSVSGAVAGLRLYDGKSISH
jgi:hypothetical protein